jgi:hypothetical protein
MTDFTLNLVDAIISGRATDIESAFQAAITDKISVRMESKKGEVAHNMFAKESVEEFTLEDYSVEEIEDFMLSEEFQQLDELSKKTLGSYVKYAADDRSAKSLAGGLSASDPKGSAESDKNLKQANKRKAGIRTALKKLTKEDFEQLDELSKKTLGSYVKKATTNAIVSGEALGKGEKWSKSGQIASKREKGIGKAVDKLTKEEFTLEDYSIKEIKDFMVSEEFQQLDELSKDTLKSYVKKSVVDLPSRGYNAANSMNKSDIENVEYQMRKVSNRKKGIGKAVDKLTK